MLMFLDQDLRVKNTEAIEQFETMLLVPVS